MEKNNDVKILFGNVKKKIPSALTTSIEAILGIDSAYIEIVKMIADGVLSIPDALFYDKLKYFLEGTLLLSDEEKAKMRKFLASDGNAEENCIRIINTINTAESNRKIGLICNATRCALNNEIDLALYFRIINAVNMLMEDDFRFLAEHISLLENDEENHFDSNHHTQALFMVGAMEIITELRNNGEYAFTPFAKILDASTISFDDDRKYPNRKEVIASCID